jgi:hypothetical protein
LKRRASWRRRREARPWPCDGWRRETAIRLRGQDVETSQVVRKLAGHRNGPRLPPLRRFLLRLRPLRRQEPHASGSFGRSSNARSRRRVEPRRGVPHSRSTFPTQTRRRWRGEPQHEPVWESDRDDVSGSRGACRAACGLRRASGSRGACRAACGLRRACRLRVCVGPACACSSLHLNAPAQQTQESKDGETSRACVCARR